MPILEELPEESEPHVDLSDEDEDGEAPWVGLGRLLPKEISLDELERIARLWLGIAAVGWALSKLRNRGHD